MFKKYQHIERFGTDEVEGIDIGPCTIFSKLDGTNSSVYYRNNELFAGSRNRELSLENDNAGFFRFILDNKDKFIPFFEENPTYRIFGEFLVPHTLKTYREDSWRKFWIFDIYDDELDQYIPYEIYSMKLERFELDFIPPLCYVNNPTEQQLQKIIEGNTFLIQDGAGVGEGIIIKNYGYQNKYGRTIWAKIVRNEFKEQNRKLFGIPELGNARQIEIEIAEKYITRTFIEKTRAKIEQIIQNENRPIQRKELIPRLLQTCFHELVLEETWNFVKEYKNPIIDFNKLNRFVIHFIKKRMPELF